MGMTTKEVLEHHAAVLERAKEQLRRLEFIQTIRQLKRGHKSATLTIHLYHDYFDYKEANYKELYAMYRLYRDRLVSIKAV